MRDILQKYVGQKVELRLGSGDKIEGTLAKVDDKAAHVEKLVGKDFYDAMVKVDSIDAVIFKARG